MGASSSRKAGQPAPILLTEIAKINLERTERSQPEGLIRLESLWGSSECIIIHAVRRPGCPLCREHAETLVELMKKMPMGVKLVGIVHENDHVQDIIDFRNYFGGNPVYFDRQKDVFKALGNRWSGYEGLMLPSVLRSISRVLSRGITSTSNGEGRLLGGLIIASRLGVHFEHREQYFGDFAPVEDILSAAERWFSLVNI